MKYLSMISKQLIMKAIFSFLTLFFVALQLPAEVHAEDFAFPDFTVSMMREGRSLYSFEYTFNKKQDLDDFSNTKYLDLFRYLYSKNLLSAKHTPRDGTYRIPRIVHQIWLGSKIPPKYNYWMSTWMNWLGWEYRLWTDEDVKDFSLYNQELYDIADNYGEKSDILRLEILLQYGGLYVDVDFECVKPEIFDELHRCFDFYIGFEPLEHGLLEGFDMFKVCNALMAATPDHPLIKQFIVNMKQNYADNQHLWTVERTGPAYLTREIFTYELGNLYHDQRNIYFPCTLFYPFSEPEMWYSARHDNAYFEMSNEAIAIHYWSGSWKNADGIPVQLYFDHTLHKIRKR